MFAGALYGADGSGLGSGDDQGDGSEQLRLVPGAILRLPPGKRLEFNEPPKLGETDPFVKFYLRDIAAAVGITYEQLSGDYADVTFSSARVAQMEFRRWAEQVQYTIIIPGLILPVWREFCRMALIAGHFPGQDLAQLLPVEIIPPRFAYVNPKDEVEADAAAIKARLKSREQVVGELGYDVEELDAQIAADPFKPEERPTP